MAKLPVSFAVALAIAASIGFVVGYIFHAAAGTERSVARAAVAEAQSGQRVIQAFQPVVLNELVYRELLSVNTPEGIAALQSKYKQSTLRSVEFFESTVGKLDLPNEKALAAPFLVSAEQTKSELTKAPLGRI